MTPLKVFRVDGFQAKLFQSQWDIVGHRIYSLVRQTLGGQLLDPNLNKTLLVLLSKILWNGVIIEFFKPIWGIRQGDPLSPYLFVLCMERLRHLVGEAVERGSWKPLFLSRRGLVVSHLFFTEDLMIEKIARNFIWEASSGLRKLALLS
ncbi:LINE-type retrotransposon LIb DNA, Insertion at the S11 site-like protein [Gossypium australe]|uniref:LINE-type retrotransposon LIb DNA, Insertion at the S11 site-like protein n=1 Tax=Gossypium australe TaxID=47621 RepID=A0A5B6V7X5_9ROSI|nr:LINE-type retrotransposon LIb DNA, Insertion at the S11 site-like protein [Gossypium australe]